MSDAKILKPPLIWANQKTGLIEDVRYKHWSAERLKTMKHGTYDWSTHQEQPT